MTQSRRIGLRWSGLSLIGASTALACHLLMAAPAFAGDDTAAIIAAVNGVRAAHGLAPVTVNEKLSRAAQAKAEAMAESGALAHNGPAGNLTERLAAAGYAFSEAAENLGGGAQSAKETVQGWAQSPPHARNLLVPSLKEAGAGHAAGKPGDLYGDYWCLILASPALP